MKKIKFGSMEILGYVGIVIWVAVNFLRGADLPNHAACRFLLGVLPNLGAAWGMTMFGKWMILLLYKKSYTLKAHGMLCFGIFMLALLSEWIHDAFLGSPFDGCDIWMTALAQVIIFFLPIAINDKYWKDYR